VRIFEEAHLTKQQEKITVARDSCKKLVETGASSYKEHPNVALKIWQVFLEMLSCTLIFNLSRQQGT
jgi:hypothetical protein